LSQFKIICFCVKNNVIAPFQVIQIWQRLCQAKCIPLSRQGQVLKLVVGRLQDKSCNVKKNAMHLVTTFLEGNPFAAKVCCAVLFSLSYQQPF
jgi:condensin complex subunit 1